MTAIPVLGMDAETERKDALQRLRLEHHGHELIGRMQLLGLGPLIQYFGKDWDHLRERVHESVRSILRSYSDQFIVSCPFDDESYVVFTTRGSQKEATHRCAEIGQRILHKLLGTEADTGLIEMLTWSVNDGGKPGFRRLWTIDSNQMISEPLPSLISTCSAPRFRNSNGCRPKVYAARYYCPCISAR